MSLVPWTRRDIMPKQLRSFRDELDELFSPFFDQPLLTAGRFIPLVNVREDDKHVTVTAELPGMDKEGIDIQVNGDVLTLRGERKDQKEEKGGDGGSWWRQESSYGAFTRRLALPCDVDAAKTTATMSNGILTIRLPKAEGAKTRSIKIQ